MTRFRFVVCLLTLLSIFAPIVYLSLKSSG